MGFVCLLVAFTSAVWAVLPRTHTTQGVGFVYWGNVLAHGPCELFVTRLLKETNDNLEQQVAAHVYDLAGICASKFTWVNRGIKLAFVGSALAGGVYLFA